MGVTKWDMNIALEVRYEEGQEDGLDEIVRNALVEGASMEFVKKITGLDEETIKERQENFEMSLRKG